MPKPAHVWRKTRNIQNLVGKRGTILSLTTVNNSPKGLSNHAPYHIALVRVPQADKNVMVEVCRENTQNICAGTDVKLVFRKHRVSETGLIHYAVKAHVMS